jgi:hypothetical protein
MDKAELLTNYQRYCWKNLLVDVQFTQEELLRVKDHFCKPNSTALRNMIRFQKSVTKEFLLQHFVKEIDDDEYVDWTHIQKLKNTQ